MLARMVDVLRGIGELIKYSPLGICGQSLSEPARYIYPGLLPLARHTRCPDRLGSARPAQLLSSLSAPLPCPARRSYPSALALAPQKLDLLQEQDTERLEGYLSHE